MGQYYLIVNLRKRQYLDPHKFGNGAKLLEFGASAGGTMTALAVLLADGCGRGGGDLFAKSELVGSWQGDPVVITGDYADPGKYVPEELSEELYRRQLERQLRRDDLADTETAEKFARRNCNLYRCAKEFFEDISDEVIEALTEDEWLREVLADRLEYRWEAGKLPERLKRKLRPELYLDEEDRNG